MATSSNEMDANVPVEPHGYHSAVEIDEDVGSWRDWVGPGLAILFVILALVGLSLTVSGDL